MTASAEFLGDIVRDPDGSQHGREKPKLLIILLLYFLCLLLGFFDLAEIDASLLEQAREPLYEFISLIVHVPLEGLGGVLSPLAGRHVNTAS